MNTYVFFVGVRLCERMSDVCVYVYVNHSVCVCVCVCVFGHVCVSAHFGVSVHFCLRLFVRLSVHIGRVFGHGRHWHLWRYRGV